MDWLKRNGAGLVLTAALALVAGAAIGCGSEKDGGGTGGTGGTAGNTGGTGGGDTGGTGGDDVVLCGNVACGDGELCNRSRNPPRCECTASPDSCAAFDMVCSAGKKCIAPPPAPQELTYCDDYAEFEMSPDGELICWPVGGGRRAWFRDCRTSNDQCQRPDTVCIKEVTGGNAPICYFNLCGENNADEGGNFLNGEPYGACDTDIGEIQVGGPAPTGTCQPDHNDDGSVSFVCNASGGAKFDEACRWDATRGSDMLCEQGTICLGTSLPTPACTTDDDCDSAQVCTAAGKCATKACTEDSQCGQDRYCHSEAKICLPFQTCFEDCNAGNADIGTEFASCTSSTAGCLSLAAGNSALEVALGYCIDPVCNLIEGGCEKEGEICEYAGFLGGAPLGGVCGDGSKATIAHRDACNPNGTARCEEGAICGRVTDTAPNTCLVFCDCEDGFDVETGLCNGFAFPCNAEESCASFFGLVSHPLGVCVPASEDPGTGGTGGAGGDEGTGGTGGDTGTGGAGGEGGAGGAGGAGGDEEVAGN